MNLEEKFSQLIKDELPAKVGKELQEVLLQAEKDAKEVIDLQDKYSTLEKLCKEKENIIIDLNKKLKEHSDIDTKIANLEEREKNLKVQMLELQLEEAYKRANMVKDFTSGLVRNTLFRKSVYDSESQTPYYDGNGNYIQPTVNKQLEETQSEE